jgi:hypothetical protein
MSDQYTNESVFGTKENPAPETPQRAPPEIRQALSALIQDQTLHLSTPEGTTAVKGYFLERCNRLVLNPAVTKTAKGVFGYALDQTYSHFTSGLANRGYDCEIKAAIVDVVPNKKAKPDAPDTFSVLVQGPFKSIDPEFKIHGFGVARIQGFAARDLADRFAGQVELTKVYKLNGGFPKGTAQGELPKGSSTTIFVNGVGAFELRVRPDGDAAWADLDGYMASQFPESPLKTLLAMDGKSDATSPSLGRIYAIDATLVSSSAIGGRDGKPTNYQMTVSDLSLDMNTRRSNDGGLRVFLTPRLHRLASYPSGAAFRLLLAGRKGEYTARNDAPERGQKKGDKIKTVNWSALYATVIDDGMSATPNNGGVPDPGAPAVPAAPVRQDDIV